MATITALGNRVIVEPKHAEEVTSFGLVLSDAKEEKPMKGTVISVSETAKDTILKEGDIVLFRKYSPTEFKTDEGKELFVLDVEDILAKIN